VLAATPGGAGNLPSGHAIAHNKKLVVGCGGETLLELVEVQLGGKKRMSAGAFLNGYKLATDETFGAP
jgi:methionyl-tRNA formyltransferase